MNNFIKFLDFIANLKFECSSGG